LSTMDLPDPHRFRVIEPGQDAVVYDEKIPESSVAFVTKIAVEWDTNCYSWIRLDGKLWGDNIVSFPLGSVDNPIEFDTPCKAEKEIQIKVHNGLTTAKNFHVYVGGLLSRRQAATDITSMLLPPEAYAPMDSYIDLPPSPYSLPSRKQVEEDFIL
jgi:hypothetical protein